MAIIISTQEFPIQGDNSFLKITWTGLANGDTGEPFTLAQYADRSVQIVGTFGVGGTLVFEGSIDGTTYNVLSDPQGNDLSFTAGKIEAISELVLKIRPRVSAGDGSTNLTVSMVVRKSK